MGYLDVAAIKHAPHLVQNEGSVVQNIYLFCYEIKVHGLFFCTYKTIILPWES